MNSYGGWCVGGPMNGQKYAHPYERFDVYELKITGQLVGRYVWYELTQEWIWVPREAGIEV